jgi:hypothetical protein
MPEHLVYLRQNGDAQFALVRLNETTHGLLNRLESWPPRIVAYASKRERITQNSDICVAVRNHPLQRKRPASDGLHRFAKCRVMHDIFARDQRAVDVEEVCIERIPRP